MDTNRLPKQALQYKPKGRRNIGRPRKRCRDQLHLEDQGTGNMPNPSGTLLLLLLLLLLYCSGDQIEKNEMGGACSALRVEAYTGFGWGNPRERDHFRASGVVGRIILRWIFRKWDVGVWTGSSWLRIGTGGGHL